MDAVRGEEYADCRDALLSALTIAQERASRGKANEDKRRMYEDLVRNADQQLGDLRETGNHLKDIYKNIKSYSIKHRESAKNILDLAIEEAGNLIPDADVEGLHLQRTPDDRAYIVDSKGQNVNLREGGGYRAVLGALLRYACLKAQPNALQFILFDESFFALSDITMDAMKEVLGAMKKDMTIVCIEQRRSAMDGVTDMEYTFRKDAMKNTSVIRTL